MSGWLAGSLDYILYGAACLVLFALLDLWLRRRAISARLPGWAWAGLLALLIVGGYFVGRAGDAEHARIQGFLEGIAPTYAQELERLGHADLRIDTAADDPRYLEIIAAIKRWERVNPIVSDIYTFRHVDGKVRLIADAETDYDRNEKYEGWREQRVAPGTEYKHADPDMLRALEGTITFSDKPVRDEWGVWVSAQVPLRAADGRIEAALGVDYPAEAWVKAIALGRQRMEWFLAIPVLILGFGATLAGALRAELNARQGVEARLRESEARLRTAIDSLPCDFWMMGVDGRYTLSNAAARAHWGNNLGRTLADLELPAGTHERWAEANRRAFAGELVREEARHELRGRTLHYLNIVAPVRIDGQVNAILGVNFDITDRVEAETALRRSEEKLALHVRQTPLAVIEWNLAFRVTAWNPSAQRIFGFSAAEAIGRHAVGLIVSDAVRPQIERIWTALLTQKGGARSTNDNLTKDGRVIRCEWYNTPLVDASGAVIGVASSVQDITDRDALEKQLRQAQKLESIGQLAGGVAHEFNNLLTPMMVQAELIALNYAHEAKLMALLRPIQEAAQQAAQLNQRILTVGRRTAEQRELQALNPLVENTLELLRPTLDRRIELVVSLAPGLPPVLVDRANIAQIVMNLVLNARDTVLEKLERGAPDGWVPRIAISTDLTTSAGRRDGASATPFTVPCQRLTVTDNGLGIPAAQCAHVFEPFFTTKAPGRGTGLGLAVVWSVVRGLHGWIEFDPAPDGQGTSFQVFLPVADIPSAIADAPPALSALADAKLERRRPRPLKVLLVDDNALVAETFMALLGASGHTVTTANDGMEGWHLFERRRGEFDVLLADCNMPGLNGTDLLKRVKAAGFAGRVVLVSGYLTAEKSDELLRLGADAVLRKPFTPAKLMEVLGG